MIQNFGVLPEKFAKDWIAGSIPHRIVLEDGDWDEYLPGPEFQKYNFVDTMACVTFSLLNCLETQEFQQTGTHTNYSDRWTAWMSGTTPNGNSLSRVADTVRKYGLVKEESWPSPTTFSWNEYYAAPSPQKQAELLAEGQEWLRTHSFAYEWGDISKDYILQALQHCPLQVVKPGHAIENYALNSR